MTNRFRDARTPLRAATLLALLVALACTACVPSKTQQEPADPSHQEQVTDRVPDAQDEPAGVLQLTKLLESPETAYDDLEAAGLTWRDDGSSELGGEHWPNAMVDSEASHPLFEALAALGAEQPETGADYFVGPAYVCLGEGLAPSTHVEATQRAILSPEELASGLLPDAIALSAPLTTPLDAEQLSALASEIGLEDESSSFSFDDTGKTDVVSEARAGTVRVGDKDCVWYVQQYGYAGEGSFAALRAGVLPVETARAVVDTSVLGEIGQLGSWDDAGTEEERIGLFATAVAQDVLVGTGVTWTSVVTGEQVAWDGSANAWRIL